MLASTLAPLRSLFRQAARLTAVSNALPALALAAAFVSGSHSSAWAQAPASGPVTLFENVRIFDGTGAALSPPSNVLVQGNIIERISTQPIPVNRRADTRIIDGGGRVLMPGLIDAHWHSFLAATSMPLLSTANSAYLQLLAARQAEATLMRGFTTVRDMGGPVFGLKRAIDEGVMIGPRIYPSGAMISQTSGHGDARFSFEVPRTLGGPLSHSEVEGVAAIADSPDEVRLRAREQLRHGASQIKLMGGGGVSSPYNPIESTQFTEAEIQFMTKELKPLLVPEFAWVAEIGDDPVGFTLCLPDINVVLTHLNGRLTRFGLPIGLIKLLLYKRHVQKGRLIALGVVEKYRRAGIAEMLVLRVMEETMVKRGITGELSMTLEDNFMVNRFLEAIGAQRYKTYRIYRKQLPS